MLMCLQLQLLRAYKPQKYRGKITLLRAEERYALEGVPDPLLDTPSWGWDQLTSHGVEVTDVPGDHDTIIFKPFVEGLAQQLRECLARGAACEEGTR